MYVPWYVYVYTRGGWTRIIMTPSCSHVIITKSMQSMFGASEQFCICRTVIRYNVLILSNGKRLLYHKNSLPPSEPYMTLAQEKGASSWLTALPIEEFGFTLHKSAFRDAVALRYGWQPANIPSTCACGKEFTVEHVLSCAKGGFPSIRHNEIRDVSAQLMS